MSVTIRGTILDVTGEPDAAPWTFSSILRDGSGADDRIITTRVRTVTPVAGKLEVELDPGYAIVGHGDQSWAVTVPDNDVNLWDLITVAVGVPPSTGTELLDAAFAAYGASKRAELAAAIPILFGASTAVVGVTPTDRAPIVRTLTGARMRVGSAAVGSALIAQVQYFAGSAWNTLATLTIGAGSIIEALASFSHTQNIGDLVRINVTSVGSTTAATGVVVEVTWTY